MPHALIVDDDRDTRDWLTEVARQEGFTVASAESLRSARSHLERQQPDLLLTDLHLPDGNGIDLVGDLDKIAETEIIVITGHASIDSAVGALRAGATDYLTKPIDLDRLVSMLRRQPRTLDLKHEIGELRDELRKAGRFGHLYGSSPPMQILYDKMARVAPTSATVLLIGESGTGKELAARTLHDLSKRKRAPFLAVNCGAIPAQLIESELFGHEKGSFPGADQQHKGFFDRANGGTVLLDEITEMSLALQVKLLRVLETGTFVKVGTSQPLAADVRIIAATNKQPAKAVAEGKFREDLFHRLNVFPIRLPPLRERREDIALLAEHFLAEICKEEGKEKKFTKGAYERMNEYDWPGNVRELRNVVQRAFVMASGATINDEWLELQVGRSAPSEKGAVLSVRIGTTLSEVERTLIFATLEHFDGHKERTAAALGVSLKTLYNRLKEYGADTTPSPKESRAA